MLPSFAPPPLRWPPPTSSSLARGRGAFGPTPSSPLPLFFLYMGNTRKPEKVEYFHPPIRFPLSSLR